MYPGIELRLLRYVVAVAEELNFTRAADRLHVAQPSLSSQIRGLEKVLGSPIFCRTKRHVSLTEAGVLFVEEAREAVRHSQQAENVVRSFRPATHLHVGYSPYVNPDLITAVRSLSETAVPNGTLSLKSYFTRRQLSKLRDGRLDAALVILPVNASDIVIERLLSESLLVALPDGHSLARNRTVALSDLKDMPAISFPQKLHPEVFQQLSESCARGGLKPNIAHEVTTFPEALPLVAQGEGYTFIRKCFTPFLCPGIVLRPIKGNPLTIETGVAYLRRRKTVHLDAFLSSLKQVGNSSANNNGRAVAA
jgi:DNA-binding transcriptional LysR family regulator